MISLAWKKREIPLYWKNLTHKEAINLTEQKAVIPPVIRLLKGQRIIITADEDLMSQNRHKLPYYERGLKAMNKVVN